MDTMTQHQHRQVESIKDAMESLTAPIRSLIQECGYPEDFLIAIAVVSALNSMGTRAELFAGSASWPVMDYELQGEAMLAGTEVIPRFGYAFDPISSFPSMVKHEYPDTLHAWAVTSERVIYDFTLMLQRQAFRDASGIGWPVKTAPPDVIVGSIEDIESRGWKYQPNEQASGYVRHLAARLVFMLASGVRL